MCCYVLRNIDKNSTPVVDAMLSSWFTLTLFLLFSFFIYHLSLSLILSNSPTLTLSNSI